MSARRYLGMRAGDLDGKPYAKFWNPTMAPLPAHAREALAQGAVASPILPPLDRAHELVDGAAWQLEDGFAFGAGGALHIAIRTEMPHVSPKMVDWWFGWHSEEPQRYKLWHPRAHVHAEWAGENGSRPHVLHVDPRERYVGRTSHVDEYIGSVVDRYAIRFILPSELGIASPEIDRADGDTAVCARVGFAKYPVDVGYLVHHVRRVPGGAEMRSRFWIGGPHVAGRSHLGTVAGKIAKRVMAPNAEDARALLVHCSQEMSHLATFLPQLHAELGTT